MIHVGKARTLDAELGCEHFFATAFSLRVDDGSTTFIHYERSVPKMPTHLKPFLNRLETCLRYQILPILVVFRRFAFCPHS
jgi:hypothetical protein